MPLTFNIRHLEGKDLELTGELPSEELELELNDEMIRPAEMLKYDLEVEHMDGAALVQGELSLNIDYTCVRCLKKFTASLEIPNWVCHLPLKGEDATPISNDLVNLTPYIREDILLALPQHPLCEPECVGLKLPATVKEPGGASAKTSSAWSELDKLKLKN
ncbi:MAG TPA: YceD family protein [Candidatus Limnocylindria bacterium]|nr:YceD family protein [Candidatus Limnocylindria bacterium]